MSGRATKFKGSALQTPPLMRGDSFITPMNLIIKKKLVDSTTDTHTLSCLKSSKDYSPHSVFSEAAKSPPLSSPFHGRQT